MAILSTTGKFRLRTEETLLEINRAFEAVLPDGRIEMHRFARFQTVEMSREQHVQTA
jgi:hypothetical protein